MGKLKSVKTLIVIWAVAMITYIIIADRAGFYGIAERLVFVPLAYIPVNVAQKKIYADKESGGRDATEPKQNA